MSSPEEHADGPAETAAAQATEPSAPASGAKKPAGRGRRFGIQRVFVRLVGTGGVIGIGAALGAILASSKVQGWITGLAVALVSVLLAAVLWSSKQL